jgi:2-dehydro-3-deoxygluconokinase
VTGRVDETAADSVDVLVLGEVLVELTARQELAEGAVLTLGISGDALNSAAAAAAAGARTALLARVPDDELGDVLVARVAALGVDTAWVRRVPGEHGMYMHQADPSGNRQFHYARRGSVGSGLAPEDVPAALVRAATVVLASGVTCAISPTARAAVQRAAELATCFVYDPNWRPRLADGHAAARDFAELAPHAFLVTPSWPGEASTLLGGGVEDPVDACAAMRRLGAKAVALTRGADGVLLDDGGRLTDLPAYTPSVVVDQTGAGDVLAGTVVARLAQGDALVDAVRLGAAAAALSLEGEGGTGRVPTLAESRALTRDAGRVSTEVGK